VVGRTAADTTLAGASDPSIGPAIDAFPSADVTDSRLVIIPTVLLGFRA